MRRSRMNSQSRKKVLAILALALLIVSSLMILEVWDSQKGHFVGTTTQSDVVKYNGIEYELKPGIETFLVLGLDKNKDATTSESHSGGTVQADFLMLFVFDNEKQTTAAIQINRDTMANVHRLDIAGNHIGVVEKKQIALAYNYAFDDDGLINCRNTADSVSDLLLDVKVNHYISLTMDCVVEMNDFVGGVEVKVLHDFTGIDDELVAGKTVTLKGEQALTYVRTRQGLEDSTNNTRMERQQQYVDALISKTLSLIESDPEFVFNLADKLGPFIEYDTTDYRLKQFAEKFDSYEFTGIRTIEGKSVAGEEFMEFYADETSIWQIVLDLFYTPKSEK